MEHLLRYWVFRCSIRGVAGPERDEVAGRRTLRADAARNRAAIIDAAAAVLAQQGSAVDVREIARRSGVGMGTLYRHFPTKGDLFVTVLQKEFRAMADSARRTAAGTDDPWTALTGFFDQVLTCHAHHRALMESFAESWSVPTADCALQLHPVIEELFTRAVAAGVLRSGVTSDDLSLLLASLARTVQMTNQQHPQMWRRLLRISLDGLRSDQAPLPPDADSAL